MGGIRCHECGAVVTTAAARIRLTADGVNWTANIAMKFVPLFFEAEVSGGAGLTGAIPPKVDNPPESGVLAELYNAQEYKCINKHSGSWVTN